MRSRKDCVVYVELSVDEGFGASRVPALLATSIRGITVRLVPTRWWISVIKR